MDILCVWGGGVRRLTLGTLYVSLSALLFFLVRILLVSNNRLTTFCVVSSFSASSLNAFWISSADTQISKRAQLAPQRLDNGSTMYPQRHRSLASACYHSAVSLPFCTQEILTAPRQIHPSNRFCFCPIKQQYYYQLCFYWGRGGGGAEEVAYETMQTGYEFVGSL